MHTTRSETIGAYELVEKIADGGMGTVYRGRHRESGERVAIKIMPSHLSKNPVMVKRFEQEYQAAKALDHPNIVRALDFGYDNSCPYMVMEFVEGESLGQRLERIGALSEEEAIHIIAQTARGLHKAHKRGLIHRDVKPDNILITPDGVAKLTDLGLVKELDADLNLTRTGRGLGTPHFMAPEQFRNAKKADLRCDIYSLGATLYNMVTGELPFKACSPVDALMKKLKNELPPPSEVMAGLSERMDWAIRRAMSGEPSLRPANCREFLEDLIGHSTRNLPLENLASKVQSDEVWHVLYQDAQGAVNTRQAPLDEIRRSIKEGTLGDMSQIRASREQEGPFLPLKQHAEFRDLVVEPAPYVPRTTPTTPVPEPAADVGSDNSSDSLPVPVVGSKSSAMITPRSATRAPILPAPGSAVHAPLIDLTKRGETIEWVSWAVLFFIAMAGGLAGFYLMPLLGR